MKNYRVTYDCGGYYSTNLIDAVNLDEAKKYAETHAANYGYSVLCLNEIAAWEREEAARKGMPVDVVPAQEIENSEPEQNDQNEQEEETMTETRTAADLIRENLNISTRSAWLRGVAKYAADLLADLDEAEQGGRVDHDVYQSPALLRRALLNGASNWKQYSEGGCSLIYDAEIAARLCNASELKLTRNGQREPNSRESWLDIQARALYQAAECIARAAAIIAE